MGKLLLPGEKEQEKLPKIVKMYFVLLVCGAMAGVLFNECSVAEVQADEPSFREHAIRTKALESIAGSLKEISSTLKDIHRVLDKR